MSDIIKIKKEYLSKLNNDLDLNSINQIKSELFGKSGKITNEFKKIGSISADERKKFASDLNLAKDELQTIIENKIKDIEIKEINLKLQNEQVDVTLPERSFNRGRIHPVSQVIDEISSIFSEIGFSVAEGPDVENEY
ncbi:MAG: phenylalanine--tRNA ligase subunit alpha, partial [Candidatus Pelagibacter sp.]|nr:phenylalanine--tRNA ligase subunit alpha [Candidatus Pelagibacter sp.]